MFHFVTFVVNCVVILSEFVLSVPSDKPSTYRHIGDNNVQDVLNILCYIFDILQNPSPELSSSFLSRLTWWWLNGYGDCICRIFSLLPMYI